MTSAPRPPIPDPASPPDRAAAPSPDPSGAAPTRVRFRGTRGSIPSPGPDTMRYGGNTPCVELRSGETLLVLDAGTGIRTLGADLSEGGEAVRATVLLTHFHWDHIQGLPFFQPIHDPSARLEIVAPADRDEYVEERLARQMDPVFFPVPFHGIRADCRFRAWNGGPVEVEGVRVRVLPVRHPSRTVGYRIETPDAVVCYLPDHELVGGRYDAPDDWRQRLERFLAGADLVIHDTMYTEDEYPRHEGWGHSTPEQALELARAAGVRRLVGFHHAPGRSDDDLDALALRLGAQAEAWGCSFGFAAEGQEVRFPPSGTG